MSRIDCSREQDVIDAVASGRWPGRVDDELRAHAATCRICADAAEVADVLLAESHEAFETVQVPSAEVMWWRAQMRARAEAAELAARPVAIVQWIGVACAVGAAAGVLGTAAWWLRSWTTWLTSALATIAAGTPGTLDVAGLVMRGTLLGVAVWLVLAPVAVYLALADD